MFTTVEQVKEIVTNLLNKTGRGGFITGVVTSVEPLKIRINQRLEISATNLYVADNCVGINIKSDDSLIPFKQPLVVGDGVILLTRPADLDGTKYILLDKINEYSVSADVNADMLIPSSLPANGGNADTVGGKSANDFVAKTGGTITGDLNITGNIKANNFHPIGSVYISFVATSPASLFGGAWERISERFLWCTNHDSSLGVVGGENEHLLSVSEMPSHSHSFHGVNDGAGSASAWGTYPIHMAADRAVNWNNGSGIDLNGGNVPHNNVPRFITVAAWKRIS